MAQAEMLYCGLCGRKWNATADHHDRTCPECGRPGE
jgi:DNA-directed RNA polymerase subunit RPC12/RpoP